MKRMLPCTVVVRPSAISSPSQTMVRVVPHEGEASRMPSDAPPFSPALNGSTSLTISARSRSTLVFQDPAAAETGLTQRIVFSKSINSRPRMQRVDASPVSPRMYPQARAVESLRI
jgi:hypothetical protein